ncbi:hypothetical protein [Salirhabdus salicampi]|uniref:hypothetical protein n=1 Tax=Salirhabdus salicampi TaxID=476102 RepID=UPI0020C52F76|nr:hypothetical protein [Salirhabdus salicampi]MCP8615228.1 hypothetical protein [Salirhabdus salicampi]
MHWETIDSFNTTDAEKVDKILEYLRTEAPHITWRTKWTDHEMGAGINLQVPLEDEEEALEVYESLHFDSVVGFTFDDEDFYVINSVKNIIHKMLKHSSTLTATQIIGLGNGLYAIERLPEITKGVDCRFSINYKSEEEFVYINFEVSEYFLEISRGGSVYNYKVGSDTYSLPLWLVEAGGYSRKEAELYNLEEEASDYLNLGATIEVEDESRIEIE